MTSRELVSLFITSIVQGMPTIYKVFGNVADKPESFGELGTLGVFCIAPPTDICDFRCVPQMSVAFWTKVLSPLKEMPNWPGSYTPIGAEEIPEGLTDTTKIGSSLVFRHQGSSHTSLQSLVVDGRLVMAVSFENSKLQFRLRNMLVELDCEWARGAYGIASFKWEPGRIWIEYCVAGENGQMIVRTKSSDDFRLDAIGQYVTPGENMEERQSTVENQFEELELSVAVSIVCKEKLEPRVVNEIVQRYAKAAHELIGVEDQSGEPMGMKVFFKYTVVSSQLIDAWCEKTGKPPGFNGDVSTLLLDSNVSSAQVDDIQALMAHVAVQKMIRITGPGDSAPLSVGLQGRDVPFVFWFHVARGHVLHGESIWRLRDLISGSVWNSQERLVLDCTHLEELYDSVGIEWLENKCKAGIVEKSIAQMIRGDLKGHPLLVGWNFLRGNVIIPKAPLEDFKLRAWGELTSLMGGLENLSEVLRGELLHRVRGEDHQQAMFEVAVAEMLTTSGAIVEFVPTGNLRSPDLLAVVGGTKIYVECSQKQNDSAVNETARNLVQDLAGTVLSLCKKNKQSVKIEIRLHELLTPANNKHVRDIVKKNMFGGAESTEVVSITSSKLGDWWDVYDFCELTKEIGPDCEQVFHGGIQKPGWETYKATGASVVGIGMASERHLADSVLRTLKKKGSWVSKKGQMPDGECGVIAIGLGECSRSGAEQVMKAVVKRFENFHKSVSAVMLLWDERTSEQFLTSKIDTFCIPVRNNFADCPLQDTVHLPTGLVRRVGITTEPGPPQRGPVVVGS